MNCKDYEKMIPDFINEKQDYPSLKKFIEHIEQCESCKEELTIQFLVAVGLKRMEDGSAFDLQKELDRRLSEAHERINFHGKFIKLGTILELSGIGVLCGIAGWLLHYRFL